MNNEFLIVGLGNPGTKFENTRHNVGFKFVDELNERLSPFLSDGFTQDKKAKAETVKGEIEGNKVIIAKPQTFMNLSGESVSKLMSYYKIKPERLIVISDDTYLKIGEIRFRKGGSSGGHNGIQSIIDTIGDGFWRIKIGIGEQGILNLEDYVLQKLPEIDQKDISKSIDSGISYLIESISSNKLENTTIN